MRIILTKSYEILGKKKAVGTVLTVTPEKALEMIEVSQEYKGKFPPKKKHKMNLSQLKK